MARLMELKIDMHFSAYAIGVIAPLTAVWVFSRCLDPARRRLVRTQAAIETAILAAIFGISWACELNAG
jgi:hypothetical protein